MKICILDYGSGNVGSVYNLLERLDYSAKISNEPVDMKNATHLILPGVGSFGASIEKIKENRRSVQNREFGVIAKKKVFVNPDSFNCSRNFMSSQNLYICSGSPDVLVGYLISIANFFVFVLLNNTTSISLFRKLLLASLK